MSFYLPPLMAFETYYDGLYLAYNELKVGVPGIRFSENNVFSRFARFQVIQATIGGGSVHIKSLHNRKFLRRKSADSGDIVPEGDEMDESTSSGTCTLFKPELVDDPAGTFKMLHVRSGQRLMMVPDGTRLWRPTTDETGDGAQYRARFFYRAIDLESMIILPRHVAFKGSNGKYLRSHMHSDGRRYLVFDTDDRGHRDSWFEVFTAGNGSIYVVQRSTQASWWNEYADSYIYSDRSNNGDVTTGRAYVPQKVNGSTIGIKRGNLFADTTFNSGVPQHCLQLRSPSLTASSRFGVEELVLERRVYNAVFDLANAMIYGETPLVMATQTANNNSDEPNTMELKFTYTDTKSSTWTSTNSWMVGVTVSVDFSIPFIGGGGVEATTEFSGSYEWGETLTTETSLETTYTTTVPARTAITVALVATQGRCDVDYSFYQRDRLYDGTSVVFYKDDGVYKGINNFNFRYEVSSRPIIREGLSSEEDLTPKVKIIPITPSVGRSEPVSSTTQVDAPVLKPITEDGARVLLLPLEVIDQEI